MVSPTRDGRVVLLHGQPGVGAAWRRVVGMLDGTLDVLAPDRPGYGRNARPPAGITGQAECLHPVGSVATPAVVIGGRRDRVTPFAASEALAARLPQGELVAVPKGGHALHRTHPEVVAHAIRRMLGDVARP